MILKRLFDLAVSIIALLALIPALLLVGIWVHLDSAGPMFYRQVRVGRNGKTFRIFKFRTMRADAPGLGPEITVNEDPRITRSGRFLRRYKLDEMPQFLNVLVGDMSVVGPRPEVPRYVAMYSPEQLGVVLSVRPGITDLASIRFRNENQLLDGSSDPEKTYVEVLLPAKLALGMEYVRSRSLRGDVAIIARTLWAVLVPDAH